MKNRKIEKNEVVRKILPGSADFKRFWKEEGPFAFALTSNEYPPILLDEEEWLFSHDLTALLKDLMGFEAQKMKIVKSPFNPDNKNILRPESLSIWKINNFPEEWDALVCTIFVPQGHLTQGFFGLINRDQDSIEPDEVENLFFVSLASCINDLGYELLAPKGKSKNASIHPYIREWEEDEKDAGIL